MTRLREYLKQVAVFASLGVVVIAGVAAYAPNATFTWINTADPAYGGLVSDEDDDTGCSWTSSALTCTSKTFSSAVNAKQAWAIDYAGTSFVAATGTFGSTITNSGHTINFATGTPSTTGALEHITGLGVTQDTTNVGYLIGDTVGLPLCSGCTAVSQSTGVVSEIAFYNDNAAGHIPTIVNAGTGSGIPTTCTVLGTTGYPLAGNFIQVNVTTDGTKVTGFQATVYGNAGVGSQGSFYTANMTNMAVEPMAAGTCTGLSGLTLNFKPGGTPVTLAFNIKANDLTTGFYQHWNAADNTNCANKVGGVVMTTLSGVGSGAAENCIAIPAAARWCTDNTATFINAMTAANARSAAKRPAIIYTPGGKYCSKPTNVPIAGFGSFVGDAALHTTIFLLPNVAGDFVSTLDSTRGGDQFVGGTLTYSNSTGSFTKGGGRIAHFSVVGMRSSSQIQNEILFYGGTTWKTVEDVSGFYIRGRCLGVGADGPGPGGIGQFAESVMENFRCENAGAADFVDGSTGRIVHTPAIQIGAYGATSGPNNLRLSDIRTFDAHSTAVAIFACLNPTANNPTPNNPHKISWLDSHVEQSKMSASSVVGDDMQLGDANCVNEEFPAVGGGVFLPPNTALSSGVNQMTMIGDEWNNGTGGYGATAGTTADLHFYGTSAGDSGGNYIDGSSFNAAGAPAAGGIFFDAGGNTMIRNITNSSNDWNFRAGTSPSSTLIGPGLTYDCGATPCNYTAQIEADALPGGPNQLSYPVYTNNVGHPAGVIFSGTQAITNGNSTGNNSMFGTGIGSTRLGPNGVGVGTQFAIKASGVITTKASAPGTLQFTMAVAGATIGNVTITPAPNMTVGSYNLDIACTFYTIGVSGTVFCGGAVQVSNGPLANASMLVFPFGNTAAPETVDTTSIMNVVLRTQWATADPNNAITNQQARVQWIN